MTDHLSRDKLRQILNETNPSSSTDHSTPPRSSVDRREDWLKAAATCARLLLYPPEDKGFHFLIGSDCFEKLTKLPVSQVVAGYRERLTAQGVSVLGIHFLDKLVGRWSRIWMGECWPSAVYPGAYIANSGRFEFLKSKNHSTPRSENTCENFIYHWLFSHLWMRAYWRELRTTATLINAFHDGILSWNQALHFRWDAANGTATDKDLPRHGVVTFDSVDVDKYFRSISAKFADTIHRRIQRGNEFSELLGIMQCYFRGDKCARSTYLKHLRVLTNQIHDELSGQAILERFRDNACRVRQLALADKNEKWSKWLLGAIKDISGSDDAAECEAFYNPSQAGSTAETHKDAWERNLAWIEAIYSALMNGSSFTGKCGFTLNRIASFGEDLHAFVVVGFKNGSCTNAEAVDGTLWNVYDYLRQVVELAHEQCSEKKPGATRASRKIVTPRKGDASEVSRDVVEIANHLHTHVKRWAEPYAVQRWLQVIKSLADHSVHEGTEIKYLLGFGPAYLSRVRGRVYEPAPDYFLADTSEDKVHRVTHYLKSYFSLFGQKGKMCWFDPEGCFRGVFEFEEPSASASDHLRGEIVGHRKFDIFGIRGDDVLARYRDGTFYYPHENFDELEKKLESVVRLLLSELTEHRDAYTKGLQTLITNLIRRLEERGVGCGLVVMLDSSKENKKPDKGKWPSAFKEDEDARLPFDSQCKRLAPKLERFEGPIVLHDDIVKLDLSQDEMKLQRVVDALVPLAKLDGAILLRIKPEIGICCEAACQIIPMIKWKIIDETSANGKYEELLPVDIFNVPSETSGTELPRHDLDGSLGDSKSKRLTLQQLKRLMDILRGSQDYNDEHALEWLVSLSFLNSAGTRHHSLWGITVSAEEPLFTVTISSDGDLRLFCDGRVTYGPKEGPRKKSHDTGQKRK